MPVIKKYLQDQNFLWWVLVLVLFMGLIWIRLWMPGMFFDGVTYAAISMNLSNGIGEWYRPVYTQTIFNPFFEHPPLAFILEAGFFKILGESYLTEKVYCLVVFLLTVGVTAIFWRKMGFAVEKVWLPLLFWLSIPLTNWAYLNNVLEITVTLFAMLSCALQYRSLSSRKYTIIWLGGAALSLIAGVFSKGPVGLYPLAFLSIIALFYDSPKRCIKNQLGLIVIILLLALMLSSSEGVRINITQYYHHQLEASLLGQRKSGNAHFYIFIILWKELMLPLILTAIVVTWRVFRRQYSINRVQLRLAMIFLLTGLSASLPMIVSQRLSRFYIVPALPWFALAAAAIVASLGKAIPGDAPVMKNFRQRILALVFLALMMISPLFLNETPYRNEKELALATRMAEWVPKQTVVAYRAETYSWTLVAYLYRYAQISLLLSPPGTRDSTLYVLAAPQNAPDPGRYSVNADVSYDLMNLYIRNPISSH